MFDELTNEMLAAKISNDSYWDVNACIELCKRAGLEIDPDNYLDNIYHAAEILGVSID